MILLRGFLRTNRWFIGALAASLVLVPTLAGVLLFAPSAADSVLSSTRVIEAGIDTDADGLDDLAEARRWGTNPMMADSDGDTLPDAWEVRWARVAGGASRSCPDPLVADAARDCIGKGLSLAEDLAAGTNPHLHDSDGDGIEDATELRLAMDPLKDDADADPFGDALTNRMRALLGARADRFDTACSGMSDAEKARRGLDPARASTGGSGVPDGWAVHYDLDPADPLIGTLRLDGAPEGLTVLEKAVYSATKLDLCAQPDVAPPFERGLHPHRADSDDDGLPDAWEIRNDRDPLDPTNAAADADGDGLTDLEEYSLGGCPSVVDCDGDGLTDREETFVGWNVTVDGETRHVLSDPRRFVSDGDLIPDGAKRAGRWTLGDRVFTFAPLDPGTPDTDGDDLADSVEILRFAGVLRPDMKDSDADGLADGEEAAYWDARGGNECALCDTDGDGFVNVADPDSDGDGLSDGDELRPRPQPITPGSASRAAFPASDPARTDTDDDGLPDAWEKRHAIFATEAGTWDLDPSRADSLGIGRGCGMRATCADSERDLDDDGLSNAEEFAAGTDPHDPDSDGDGLPDGWEQRFGAASGQRAGPAPLSGHGFEWLLRPGKPIALSPLDGGDALTEVARYSYVRYSGGVRTDERVVWTFLDLYRLGVSPIKPASGSDGIPDLYKTFWSEQSPGAFDVPDADGDGRTNQEEYVAGTDPLARDTDGGGLDDLAEATLRLDPLEPGDDAGEGDLDGDGLSNALEITQWRTRVDSADTDGDGLLDGGDIVLRTGGAQATRLVALGIVHRVEGDTLRFFGESRVSADPTAGCALKWSCSGDGLPDAWKVYYNIEPMSYHPPTESRTADGLGILAEYSWGRPAWWNESQHGPWWLGLDPTRADTNRDGIRDDEQTRIDGVADLDRDGLNDLSGEDPTPIYGDVDLLDRAASFASLQARGGTATIPEAPLVNLTITTPIPATIQKGGTLRLNGWLDRPIAGVPVLARLVTGPTNNSRTGVPDLVHGVGFTHSDGTFTLDVDLTRLHGIDVPFGVASVFGATANGTLAWEADTRLLTVGQDHHLVVWSHAVPGAVARGVALPDTPVRVTSEARLMVSGELAGAPGATIRLNTTLQDGAGDERAIADPSRVALTWLGSTLRPTSITGANASFRLTIPSDAPPALLTGRVTYAGDALLAEGAANFTVVPRLTVRLTLAELPREVAIGETITIRGQLADERGAAIIGSRLSARLAGASANATTLEEGHFAVTLMIPPTSLLGSRTPSVTFDGDTHYTPATVSGATVALRSRPAFANVTTDANLGRAEIRGMLLASGVPVVDPTLQGPPRVSLNADGFVREITPASDGSFRIVMTGDVVAHPRIIRIELTSQRTSLVDPARHTIDVVIAGDTHLTLESVRAQRGGFVALGGSLRDTTGAPLSGGTVTLSVAGVNMSATTNASGAFVARANLPAATPLGSMLVTAAFEGLGSIHQASTATAQITILAATTMRLSRGVVDVTAPVLEAYFSDDTATARTGEPVDVTIDDQALGTLVTREDGGVTIHLPVRHLTRPSLLIGVRIHEGQRHAAFEDAEPIFLNQPTTISFIDPPTELVPGEGVTVRLRVVTALGAAVPDADIEVTLDEVAQASARTRAGAIASADILVPANATLGPAVLQANFGGHDQYLSSTTGLVVLIRAIPSLSASYANSELRIVARAPDGTPIPGAQLIVTTGDATLLVEADATGSARLRLSDPDASPRVRFAGSPELRPFETTAARTSTPGAGFIGAETATSWWPMAVISAATILVILVMLYGRYRRRTLTEVERALARAENAFLARNENDATVFLAYRALVAALAQRGLAHAGATPRETQLVLASAFPLPPGDLEDVIEAFERARYGTEALSRADAVRVSAALARLRAIVHEAPP